MNVVLIYSLRLYTVSSNSTPRLFTFLAAYLPHTHTEFCFSPDLEFYERSNEQHYKIFFCCRNLMLPRTSTCFETSTTDVPSTTKVSTKSWERFSTMESAFARTSSQAYWAWCKNWKESSRGKVRTDSTPALYWSSMMVQSLQNWLQTQEEEEENAGRVMFWLGGGTLVWLS